jgi:hypothetical protein
VAALFYSLIESAKLSGIEPDAYLRAAARAAIGGKQIPFASRAQDALTASAEPDGARRGVTTLGGMPWIIPLLQPLATLFVERIPMFT